MPQIPAIGYWTARSYLGAQSEEVPHICAINDQRGRVMVLFTHDTDFGDGYEREPRTRSTS